MTLPAITEQVRDMYTRFPYPPPGVLAGTPIPAIMDYTRFIFWPERRDLSGLRVLDAGCGTGDTAVAIAAGNPNIQVVGIDLSETSLGHARSQADQRGVGSNLELRCQSIEEVASLGQQFDYVISSGVIHHLDNPARGLNALVDVLAPTGGIFLMLYATYGRAGVYQMQDALRLMAGAADYDSRVALARDMVQRLPQDHPFKARQWTDSNWPGDAGLVDLLLHVRDRSYTVPQLFELLDGAGLQLARFMDPLTYEPSTHVGAVSGYEGLPFRKRAELAELLCGSMRKHSVYATRQAYTPFHPSPTGELLLALRPRLSPLFAWDSLETPDARNVNIVRVNERPLSDHYERHFDLQRWSLPILSECNGQRTALALFMAPEIQNAIPGRTVDDKLNLFGGMLQELAAQELVFCEL
ncbi:MAG TPA: class I SAM-dependent methyltransferase [Chloroflexota bacterium]|jgi:SAM-dependent methyltransferase